MSSSSLAMGSLPTKRCHPPATAYCGARSGFASLSDSVGRRPRYACNVPDGPSDVPGLPIGERKGGNMSDVRIVGFQDVSCVVDLTEMTSARKGGCK